MYYIHRPSAYTIHLLPLALRSYVASIMTHLPIIGKSTAYCTVGAGALLFCAVNWACYVNRGSNNQLNWGITSRSRVEFALH